jgi:hypothetical protein
LIVVPWTTLRLALTLACVQLAGCAHLLPAQAIDTRPPFDNFEAARSAVSAIVPFRTRASELPAMGFDILGQRNVTLVAYPDSVARLAPNANVPLSQLDAGIRECILAGDECRVYGFHFGAERRDRRGGFLADFFNFERTTAISAWRLDALVAVRGDLVLFRSFGGNPDDFRIEHQRNPLGPLQSAGDQVLGATLR